MNVDPSGTLFFSLIAAIISGALLGGVFGGLSAVADGNTIDYGARRFTTKNSIRRNTQVNIRARITSTTNVTLDFNVSDWDTYTVNVPDFN